MSIIFLYGFFSGLLIQWENTKEKGMRKVGGEREKGKRKARLSRSLEQAIAEPNGGETNLLGPRDPRYTGLSE